MGVVSRIGVVAVGTVGLLVLVGWFTRTTALTTVLPGLVPMKPTTAVALIVLSLSLLVARRRAAVSLAAVPVFLGAATLVGYGLGSTLGIAGWVPGIDLAGVDPRMSPVTAVGLIVLAAALIACRLDRLTLLQVFAHVSLLISLIALLGYAYGVSSLYTVTGFTSVALHTAVSLAILSVAVLAERPTVGVVGLLRDQGSAGVMLRRVVPFVILGPVLLGWLCLEGQSRGLFDATFGVAILITGMTVLGITLMWVAARGLRDLDRQRDDALLSLAEVNHTLEVTVDRRTRELGEVAEKLQTLIKIAPVGIVQLDIAGGLLTANDQWLALSGLTLEESLGAGWAQAMHPDDVDRVTGAWGAAVAAGVSYNTTMRFRTPLGEVNWVQVSTAPIHGLDGETISGHQATVTDITARRLAEARVEHLAFHDPLTNLPNRLLLLDRLNQALLQTQRHGRGVAVLFIDLDRFKFVNDSLGHHAGDTVLKEIGVRLRSTSRSTDTVSRIGGDEFVVICPDVDSTSDVRAIADALLRAVAEPIPVGDQVASVDASIGIAFGLGDEDAEVLLRNADQAMYLAKGRGRARYEFFDDDLRGRIERRLDTELALRHAVARGEIETWFQPIVDLQQHAVVATEALARWRHPQRGLVIPGEFIAIAEEVGLIGGIGNTVLAQACRAAAAIDGRLAVSVNVSPRQFVQDDFGAVVKRALRQSGLAPDRLWLELTESAVVEAIDSAARTFQDLRSLGVRLAIDDFGTGYSSFSHLKAFTVDLLKIDRTFIRDVECSEHDRAIVDGILRLADSLNLDVVAEGIETVGQRDLLARMGCRFGQGYLFSEPAPAAAPDVTFGGHLSTAAGLPG